jgi:hypothetical protein
MGVLARVHLAEIRRVLMESSLMRDLRLGELSKELESRRGTNRLCAAGAELLKKLRASNRFSFDEPRLPTTPREDEHWISEAGLSHSAKPAAGIIISHRLAAAVGPDNGRASIEQLRSMQWWTDSGCSLRLDRTTDAYRQALHLLLCNARSLMFIDPYCGPTRSGVDATLDLVLAARRRGTIQPAIEVHRVCYEQGQERRIIPHAEWQQLFTASWGPRIRDAGLKVEVFIWDDFHDRYLIADLMGLSLPFGFVTTKAKAHTVWTRLSRKDKDAVQREFDASSIEHAPRGRFMIQ